ncbi:MAG: PAS domain-containing protein [Opitutaceae bacterium]
MPSEPIAPSPHPAAAASQTPSSIDLLRALLENTPDGIYFKDRESRFLMISRSQARLLGLAEPQEAYGKSDHDFFSAEHADQARADERRIMDTGQPVIDAIEKETWPDGRVTWASSTKLPLRDASGRVVGTFGISRDITARVATEQRLKSAQRELKDATRAVPGPSFLMDSLAETLRHVENARVRGERIRRRSQRTSPDAIGQLASRLAAQLADGRPEHQLAVEISALANSLGNDQRALVEDLDELQHSLQQLAKILSPGK